MIAVTAKRVSSNTSDEVNERIHRETEERVARIADLGGDAIGRRLNELDREWDVERTLETLAPTFTLLGMGLGLTVSKWFFLFPIAVQTFFLQHAVQGWCPPLPVLRHLGVRTIAEIDHERNALKAGRGDYRDVEARGQNGQAAHKALQAAAR